MSEKLKLSLEDTRTFYDAKAALGRLEGHFSDMQNAAAEGNNMLDVLPEVPVEIIKKVRADLVESGMSALDVGNLSDDQIAQVAEHQGLVSSEMPGENSRLTDEQISEKRLALVADGLSLLEIGNMSDDEVEHYGMASGFSAQDQVIEAKQRLSRDIDIAGQRAVEAIYSTDQAKADREMLDSRAKATSEQIDDTSASDAEDGAHNTTIDNAAASDSVNETDSDPSVDDLEDLPVDDDGEQQSADDLEDIDTKQKNEEKVRKKWFTRLRSRLSGAGLAAEATTAMAKATENSQEKRGRRRPVLIGAMGAAGLLLATNYLMMKNGHGFGGFGNHQDKVKGVADAYTGPSGSGSGTNFSPQDIAYDGSGLDIVHVNSGDGEIKVTQRILEQQGIHVSTADAQRIGENAQVHDILSGDNSYSHSGSTLDRIGKTGDFKIKSGVSDKLVAAAQKLGFKK